jgi:excisionase family DNA binding protein
VSASGDHPFLTVVEVAETLKLNPQTVRNWIDAGQLPAVHIGRRVRIKREDFDRLIEQGYTSSTSPATEAAGMTADWFLGREGDPLAVRR